MAFLGFHQSSSLLNNNNNHNQIVFKDKNDNGSIGTSRNLVYNPNQSYINNNNGNIINMLNLNGALGFHSYNRQTTLLSNLTSSIPSSFVPTNSNNNIYYNINNNHNNHSNNHHQTTQNNNNNQPARKGGKVILYDSKNKVWIDTDTGKPEIRKKKTRRPIIKKARRPIIKKETRNDHNTLSERRRNLSMENPYRKQWIAYYKELDKELEFQAAGRKVRLRSLPAGQTEGMPLVRRKPSREVVERKKEINLLNTIVDNREQSQRTLGQQFHAMNRTLRIVRITFTGEDPLMNDFVWLGLILDFICTGFCNKDAINHVRRKSGCQFDMIPLALRPFVNDWVIYKRVLNQLPLIHCVKLCLFRWVCQLSSNALKLIPFNAEEDKEFESDEMENDRKRMDFMKRCREYKILSYETLEQIRELVASFVQITLEDKAHFVDNRQKYLGPEASKQERTKIYRGSTTKLKCRLTKHGQTLLSNACGTFQPVVPEQLKYPTENSLLNKHLYAPNEFLREVYNERVLPAYPMYDHNSRRYVAANNGDTLADYYWEDEPFDDGTSSISAHRKTTYMHVIRRNLFQHLAGNPESCAIYGLRQYYGNGKQFYLKLNDIKDFILNTVLKRVRINPEGQSAAQMPFVSETALKQPYHDRLAKSRFNFTVAQDKKSVQKNQYVKWMNERSTAWPKASLLFHGTGIAKDMDMSKIRKTPATYGYGTKSNPKGVKRKWPIKDGEAHNNVAVYVPWSKKKPRKGPDRRKEKVVMSEENLVEGTYPVNRSKGQPSYPRNRRRYRRIKTENKASINSQIEKKTAMNINPSNYSSTIHNDATTNAELLLSLFSSRNNNDTIKMERRERFREQLQMATGGVEL